MKIKQGFWILVITFFVSLGTSYSQNNKKDVDKYFDDTRSFKDRLWYGGGFNLGYSSSDFYNVFNIGITPMVGYKVLPNLSFGPRFGIDYTYLKGYTTNGSRKGTDLTTYSVGVFGRLKFLKVLFLHAEYNYQSIEDPDWGGSYPYLSVDPNNNKVLTLRTGEDNLYAGVGYNSGEGLFGYEILVLYNFNVTENDYRNPFDFRIGFTYKF